MIRPTLYIVFYLQMSIMNGLLIWTTSFEKYIIVKSGKKYTIQLLSKMDACHRRVTMFDGRDIKKNLTCMY